MHLAAATALAAVLVLGCATRGAADLDRPRVLRSTWTTLATENFVVHTDAAPDAALPVIERLEKVHEALRTTVFLGLPLARVEVLLLAQQRDFQAMAPPGLIGFYTTNLPGFEATLGDGLLVFSAEGDPALVTATAAHELAHHFLQALSDRVPTWLHEGFAKYVGALQIQGRRVVFDVGAVAEDWLRASRPLPLLRLFAADTSDFHGASARAQYLTAWLLVRELLSEPGTSLPVVATRFQELVVRTVLARNPMEVAAALAGHAGLPLSALEARVRAAHADLQAGAVSRRRTLSVNITAAPPVLRRAPADRKWIGRLCALLTSQVAALTLASRHFEPPSAPQPR